jgi:hypothetical protein
MFVCLLDPRTGELLREHLGQKRGGHRIRDADRPRRTPQHTHQLLARAPKAGASSGTLCDAIHQRQAEAGLRRAAGTGCDRVPLRTPLSGAHGAGLSEPAASRSLIRELVQYGDLIQQPDLSAGIVILEEGYSRKP